jgi:cytochrome b subunit of formate dehydrogenase
MTKPIRVVILMVLAGVSLPGAQAADSENCLMCHRFRGLARVDKDGNYRLFYVDEEMFSRGPHARVSCTGCHSDITTIPHDEAKPVDCLRNCHIEEPNREVIFTHSKVKTALEGSVHSLSQNRDAPVEYPEDYPDCKGCHDSPLFRPLAMFKSVRSGVSEQAINRCLVCHSDEKFIRYYYSHVTTRLHKARDPREVVDMCSTCHGDKAFMRRHNLPDVVSSYLESYHGKAVLLGSVRAPDCLDCHASRGNVHRMLPKSDPRSSVHAQNRAATCISLDCHSNATKAIASFDVHANRNPKTHLLEFIVALCFVAMTMIILIPILTLNVMGYIRELFPSHQAEQETERLTRVAQAKAARDNGILRFALSHRVQHAYLVIMFIVLCLTGFPLKFAAAPWAQVVLDLFGGIDGAPVVHRVAGVGLLIGFAVHVFLISRDIRRSLHEQGKKGFKAVIRTILTLPMIPNRRDLRDLVATVKYVFFISPQRPLYDRFSWKEKFEYLGLFWGIPVIGVTGILLWAESASTHILPGWLLNVAFLVHTYEALLALAHITLVHIPGIIGLPGLSPIRCMVIDGKIPPRVQAAEHGAELELCNLTEEATS